MFGFCKRMLAVGLIAALLLTTVPVSASSAVTEEHEGFVFSIDYEAYTATVESAVDAGDALVIPDIANGVPVTAIAAGAFEGCTQVTSVELPYTIAVIGDNAFVDCHALNSVTYHGDETAWKMIEIGEGNDNLANAERGGLNGNTVVQDGMCFALYPDGTACFLHPEYWGDGEWRIPETVWNYRDYAVTSIAANAFSNEEYLFHIEIPRTVTKIGENAFADCLMIDRVKFGGSEDEWGAIDIGDGNEPLLTATRYYEGTEFVEYLNSYYALLPNGTARLLVGYAESEFVTIPDEVYGFPVTEIYNNAFRYASQMMVLYMPAVQYIGENAFAECYALKEVYYGGSKEEWQAVTVAEGNDCFDYTQVFFDGTTFGSSTDLYYAVNPDGTVTILDYFGDNLAEWTDPAVVVIPETIEGYPVTSIGVGAFYQTSHSIELYIEADLTDIGRNAFLDCGISHIFYGGSQEDWQAITVADGNDILMYAPVSYNACGMVEQNGMLFYLFDDQTAVVARIKDRTLMSMVIPEQVKGYTVKEIYPYAFYGCSAECLVIPHSIERVRSNAFLNSSFAFLCYTGDDYQWGSIYMEEGSEYLPYPIYYNTYGIVYDEGLYCFITKDDTLTAFDWHGGEHLVIPDEIDGRRITKIADVAFCDKEYVMQVTIGNNVTEIGMGAFSNCLQLRDVNFGTSVETIGCNAFSNTAIVTLTLPSSTFGIETGAFSNCFSLERVIFPTFCYIGEWAFDSCSDVVVYCGGDEEQAQYVESFGISAFSRGCFTNVTQVVEDNGVYYAVRSDDTAVLTEVRMMYQTLEVASVAGGCPVTEIGSRAFEYTVVESVILPDTVTAIGDFAFCGCGSLTDIQLPSSLQTIGEYAFFMCYGLQSIDIPDAVTSIGFYAFAHCPSLKNAVIGSGIFSIPTCMFEECSSLECVTIPSTVVQVQSYAFMGCDMLTDVYYDGTNTMWQAVLIEDGNEPLLNAMRHVEITSGDLDGDDTVSTTDVRVLLTGLLGLRDITPEQLEAADYNGDGKADSTDARQMLCAA